MEFVQAPPIFPGVGYSIGAIVLLFLVVVIAAIWRSRIRPEGHLPSDHPVSRTDPAADQPTPGASDTKPPAQIERAQRRVPPA